MERPGEKAASEAPGWGSVMRDDAFRRLSPTRWNAPCLRKALPLQSEAAGRISCPEPPVHDTSGPSIDLYGLQPWPRSPSGFNPVP